MSRPFRVPRTRRAASLLELARGVQRKDPSAQIQGAIARKSGAGLEDAITASNRWYDQHGEALIEKVNPPTAGWGTSLRLAGAATVDYTGTYFSPAGRVGIAFDAKKVTGCASFSIEAHDRKHGTRYVHQLQYLLNARNRHGYRAFYLLYDDELETAWICSDLDTLARRESVPIRTKPRPTKAAPTPAIVHHLPRLAVSLERAAMPQLITRRPLLDYLSIVRADP